MTAKLAVSSTATTTTITLPISRTCPNLNDYVLCLIPSHRRRIAGLGIRKIHPNAGEVERQLLCEGVVLRKRRNQYIDQGVYQRTGVPSDIDLYSCEHHAGVMSAGNHVSEQEGRVCVDLARDCEGLNHCLARSRS